MRHGREADHSTAARAADGWDCPLGPSAEGCARKVGVLERECQRIGRDPGSIRRAAHVALVKDEQVLRARCGAHDYTNVSDATLFGSDSRVPDGIKALERAGADQVLFAGTFRHGAEHVERIGTLLAI